MAIPGYQNMILAFLKFHEDGLIHKRAEVIEYIANQLNLTDEEIKEMLPSGGQTYLRNRVSWAGYHLRKALLINKIDKSSTQITERGLEVLKQSPESINTKFLMQFEEYKNHIVSLKSKSPKNRKTVDTESNSGDDRPPEEILVEGYQKIRNELTDEILEQVKAGTPDFFERLVVTLLVAMGYGGSIKDAGKAVGRSGDEGIDGIIKEDKLGLDIIYIQAKRWDNTVGRPEIQKFAGALQGKRAKKGVFITTSDYSKGAIEFTNNLDSKIVLIDGEELAELMIDNNIGVSLEATYEIKKIDSDFFSDE